MAVIQKSTPWSLTSLPGNEWFESRDDETLNTTVLTILLREMNESKVKILQEHAENDRLYQI